MIPATPNPRAQGIERIVINPPRIARGLPHPGLIKIWATSVTIGIASRIADIFP
jgi:hypothetical protein